MCAQVVCYVFFVLIPVGGDEFLKFSATVEAPIECLDLRAAWYKKWQDDDFDVDRLGVPRWACVKTISV